MKERTYIAIDLKSFYASVECRERGLDPLDTNLVVADESRTDKTIREYQERRTALNAEIYKVLAELEALQPGGVTE